MLPAPSVATARLPRYRRHLVGTILLLALLTAPPTSAQSVIDPDLDSDGDGIVNAFDPDDDNDGLTDSSDPAPFDPANPGSPPPPSAIDPDADSDQDGIANSHDPDDDQDGLVDATDPTVFGPVPTAPESPGGDGNGAGSSAGTGTGAATGASSSRSTASTASGSPRGRVAVTALPRTGHGRGASAPATASPALWAACVATILALCALALHRLPAAERGEGRRPHIAVMQR